MSKERAAWLVRDAGMTPGPEAAVAPGTTGAAVDPGHPSISINDDRIRWSFPGPGNPLPRSMTAIENTASICPVRWFPINSLETCTSTAWTCSTLNVNSVTHALQLAWRHLQNMDPDDEEQVMTQQDLIGFFNSAPHSRICSALQLMTYRLQGHFGQPIEDLTFQVDHKTGATGLSIFKGQCRFRGSNTKVLRIQHVMELTEFLLQPAYFKVGLDTYCQIQGACMGSPLAPVLCALVAAEQEFNF